MVALKRAISVCLVALLTACKTSTSLQEDSVFVVPNDFYMFLDNEEGGMLGTVYILDDETIAVGMIDEMKIYHLNNNKIDTYNFNLNQIGLDVLHLDEENKQIIGFDMGKFYKYDFDGELIEEIAQDSYGGAIRLDDTIVGYSLPYASEPYIVLYDLELNVIGSFDDTPIIVSNKQTDDIQLFAHNKENGHLYRYDNETFVQLSDTEYEYVIDIEQIGNAYLVSGADLSTYEHQIWFERNNEQTVLTSGEAKMSITMLDGDQGFVLCESNTCTTRKLYDSNGQLLHSISTNQPMKYLDTEYYYINDLEAETVTVYNLDNFVTYSYEMSEYPYYSISNCGGYLFASTNDGYQWLYEGDIIPVRVLGYLNYNQSNIVYRKDTDDTFLIVQGEDIIDLSNSDITSVLADDTAQITFLVLSDDHISFRYYTEEWMDLYMYDYTGSLLHQGKIFAQIQLGIYYSDPNYNGYYLIAENNEDQTVRIVYYD